MTPSDTPAFPTNGEPILGKPNNKEITIRQYYAAKALQGLLARPATQGDYKYIAVMAFEYADLMLEAGKVK